MKLKEWLTSNRDLFSGPDLRFLLKTLGLENYSARIYGQDRVLEPGLLARLEMIREKYSRGLPLPYILKKEEFYGLSFYVNENVLIPRNETELVMEKAVQYGKKIKAGSVLDLCCGSGVIAVCLKKIFFPRASVFASDISPAALKVAEKNIADHAVEVSLVCTDLFSGFLPEKFDLVVTNPPYVESSLIRGSLAFEPEIALNGAEDGLKVIKMIIEDAYCYLRPGGYIISEIGAFQKESIEKLVLASDQYIIEEWFTDYSGLWRGIVLKKSEVRSQKSETV